MTKIKKVVVIGGTGLIGSKAVKSLQDAGHEAVVASSRNGINAYPGISRCKVRRPAGDRRRRG